MKVIIINIIAIFLAGNFDNSISISIRNDNSLIVPGTGAENVLLKQQADELLTIKGYPEKISELKEKKELFKDVFKVNGSIKINFDKIFYYDFQKAIFFLDSNIVTAIAGLSSRKITIDSVDLTRGVEFFVFNYGNKNLQILKKDNGSKDTIYLYSRGIAIVDDRGDDKIDMYIVFPALQ